MLKPVDLDKPLVLEPSPIRKPPLRVEPDPGVQLPQRLSGRSIADFLDLKIDPLTNVLGSRFLTIGSGMF